MNQVSEPLAVGIGGLLVIAFIVLAVIFGSVLAFVYLIGRPRKSERTLPPEAPRDPGEPPA